MSVCADVERWFHAHCDGDWEHGDGIRIYTLDNPGWAVDIDLRNTELEGRLFDSVKHERTAEDWIWMWIEDRRFTIRCGPRNLEEGLAAFLVWADAS